MSSTRARHRLERGPDFKLRRPKDGPFAAMRNLATVKDICRKNFERNRVVDYVEVGVLLAEEEIDRVRTFQKRQIAKTTGDAAGRDHVRNLVLLLNAGGGSKDRHSEIVLHANIDVRAKSLGVTGEINFDRKPFPHANGRSRQSRARGQSYLTKNSTEAAEATRMFRQIAVGVFG